MHMTEENKPVELKPGQIQIENISLEAFERLKRDRPALMQGLLTYVISVMAQRLRFASNMIGVLRR